MEKENNKCIFCKIVKGEIPCHKIYEDKEVFVFLDAFPSAKGQVLIIPKKHIAPWLFDMGDKEYSGLMLIAKKVAKAVDKAMSPVKTGMLAEGLELDHVHVKICPLSEKGFQEYVKRLDPPPSEDEMKEIAEKIKGCLEN